MQKEQDNMIQKLEDLKTASENLQTDNAKLQVYITTLESQSASLTSQHAALQLANSQLVAEKDVVSFSFWLSRHNCAYTKKSAPFLFRRIFLIIIFTTTLFKLKRV